MFKYVVLKAFLKREKYALDFGAECLEAIIREYNKNYVRIYFAAEVDKHGKEIYSIRKLFYGYFLKCNLCFGFLFYLFNTKRAALNL